MGDVLRPWAGGDHMTSGAFRNIQWTHHLIKRAVTSAGLPIHALDWNRHSGQIAYKRIDIAGYYQKRGLEITVSNWSKLAGQEAGCPILGEALAPHLDGALVIGYEMSKVQIATLESMGVSYIDLVLHPARFAPDILHAMRTNSQRVHDVLRHCHFDSDRLYAAAADIQAKICRLGRTMTTSQDTALILGQVWTDRAVAKPAGGFYKLDEFADQIADTVHQHSAVLYKPHPYERISGETSQITDMFRSITTTEANYYVVLCQPTVSSVYGLNSSCLYEAGFFGRKASYWIKPQYQLNDHLRGDSLGLGDFATLSEVWVDPSFWAAILNGKTSDFSAARSHMTPGRLRKSMNTDWGYSQIDEATIKL
jgi:hypothetical protein